MVRFAIRASFYIVAQNHSVRQTPSCSPHYAHNGHLPYRGQNGRVESLPVCGRDAELLLSEIVNVRDPIRIRIDEADDGPVLAGALHLERAHRAAGPEPVADRLEAAGPLVVGIPAPAVAARLERLRRSIVHVQALADPPGDGITGCWRWTACPRS